MLRQRWRDILRARSKLLKVRINLASVERTKSHQHLDMGSKSNLIHASRAAS
jgi:hypothetical protein